MKSREQISKTAMELFLRRGCRSVTMDDIATANGISKRTLYELFKDKNELLEECIRLFHKQDEARFDQLKNSEENVLKVFLDMLRNSRERKVVDFQLDFFSEVKKYYPEAFEKTAKKINEDKAKGVIYFVERGINEGVFLQEDFITPVQVATIILQISINTMNNISKNYFGGNIRNYSRDGLILFLRGIATDKGRTLIDEYLKNNNNL